METDADRLEAIKAVGGVSVLSDLPTFWAIFDHQYDGVSMGDLDVESRSPVLACRSSDTADLVKGTDLNVQGGNFRVLRIERDLPAPGWTTIVLRA
jgi:hypothetical protein